MGRRKALWGNEEGAPNQFVLWRPVLRMAHDANLGASQGMLILHEA